MAKNELYARLGLSETASDKEIQDAYQRLVADCDSTSERYSYLTEAYDILSDVEKRAYYDIRGKKPSVKEKKRFRHRPFSQNRKDQVYSEFHLYDRSYCYSYTVHTISFRQEP